MISSLNTTPAQAVDSVARGLAHDEQPAFRAMAERALLDAATKDLG